VWRKTIIADSSAKMRITIEDFGGPLLETRKMQLGTALILLFLVVSTLSPMNVVTGEESSKTLQSVDRLTPLTIKIVFVGIERDTIDSDYLPWKENLPSKVINEITTTGNDTGVIFSPSYEYVFAPTEFKQKLVDYLRGIESVEEAENPWFYYWVQQDDAWTRKSKSVKQAFYAADKVETWLNENKMDFGGFPDNGWTLIASYLPELPSMTFGQYVGYWNDMSRKPEPSTPHYYTMTYEDLDLGYRPSERDFMTAWVGTRRFGYLDLSAGPTYWSTSDLPLQVVLEDIGVSLHTAYGKKWFTEYLADYIREFVRNFATPQFVYDPVFTAKYRFIIQILDDRTGEEKSAVPITSTVDSSLIKNAFEDIAPYIAVETDITFKETSEYPELQNLIDAHYKYLDSWTYTYVFYEPQKIGSVDLRPIYKYLQDNLAKFAANLTHDEDEVTIPVFAFAFSEETYFTYSYKWFIDQRDPETSALWGVALDDMVIIGHCQFDFERGEYVSPAQSRKGYGFSQTIIHELGHMIGLMHPHQYGSLGDFSASAMSYFTYEYKFGQFDKDAIQRTHADKNYAQALLTMQETKQLLQRKVKSAEVETLLKTTEDLLKEADSEYARMNYVEALKKTLEARGTANTANDKTKGLPELTAPMEQEIRSLRENVETLASEVSRLNLMSQIYAVAGTSTGLVLGVLIMWAVYRRKTVSKEIPTGVQIRHCLYCGAQMPKDDIYCLICGMKQE